MCKVAGPDPCSVPLKIAVWKKLLLFKPVPFGTKRLVSEKGAGTLTTAPAVIVPPFGVHHRISLEAFVIATGDTPPLDTGIPLGPNKEPTVIFGTVVGGTAQHWLKSAPAPSATLKYWT